MLASVPATQEVLGRAPRSARGSRPSPRRAKPAGSSLLARFARPRARRTRSGAPRPESAASTSAPQLASQSETASAQLSLSSTTSTRRPERSSRRAASLLSTIRILLAGLLQDRNPSWREARGKKAGGITKPPMRRRSEQRRRPRRRSLVGRRGRGRDGRIELGVEIEDVSRVRRDMALTDPGLRADEEHRSVGGGLRLDAETDV